MFSFYKASLPKVCEDEKDKRQDLYIKARSYQGQLGARKAKMMKESDFHVVSLVISLAWLVLIELFRLKVRKGKKLRLLPALPRRKRKRQGKESRREKLGAVVGRRKGEGRLTGEIVEREAVPVRRETETARAETGAAGTEMGETVGRGTVIRGTGMARETWVHLLLAEVLLGGVWTLMQETGIPREEGERKRRKRKKAPSLIGTITSDFSVKF